MECKESAMQNKKTGVSMGSKVINVNTVKRTKANCDICVHLTNKGKIKYCEYYDLFSPQKKQCVRFCNKTNDYAVSNEESERIKQHNERVRIAKEHQRAERKRLKETKGK